MNRITLIGNAGKEPETHVINENSSVTKFSFATNETYKNKSGEKVTETQWHNLVMWNRLGEIAAKYVKKGDKLAIVGSVKYRDYEDKEGNKRYITEIICSDMEMLGSKPTTEENKPVEKITPNQNTGLPNDDFPFDDVPPPDDLPY